MEKVAVNAICSIASCRTCGMSDLHEVYCIEALKLEFQFNNLSLFSLSVDLHVFSESNSFKDSIKLVGDRIHMGKTSKKTIIKLDQDSFELI